MPVNESSGSDEDSTEDGKRRAAVVRFTFTKVEA